LFTRLKKGERNTRSRDIPTEFLELIGHRLPPQPVPRPETTFRRGRDDANVWRSYEFDIVDELAQYL
jgi:hypothetical protein